MVLVYKTMEDINKEYNGQWVYMINIQTDEHGSVIGGEVAVNNKCRAYVSERMLAYKGEGSKWLFRYAGQPPEETNFLMGYRLI
jgi:hypothetical protein